MRPVSVVRIVAEAARTAPLLGTVVSPLLNRVRDHRDGDVIATRVGRPPRTPFNRPITPHRRYAFRSVNLEEVKQVKNAHGVSVNDVVMAMSAGALRRWLIDHDALPEAPLIAMVPVSVRDEASASALGNKVSAMLAVLPTNLDDPLARLAASHAATVAAKRQHAAIPQGLVDEVTEFLPPALAARAARVVFSMGLPHRISPFNLVISNVPGPNKQVYLKGAKMTAYYPVSVVTDGQGLNITVQGYLGGLHFGLIACRELVPDVDKLTEYLVDELDLLSS
jgi:WS/DGAT/MGAT family acyltransferase